MSELPMTVRWDAVAVTPATDHDQATPGTDFTYPASRTVTIPAGTDSATFAIPFRDDQLNENPEDFGVTLAVPTNATLDKDTGFQGYEPAGVLTQQPKKTQRPGVERSRQVPQSPHLHCTRGRRKRHCRGETVSDCQRCLAPDESRHV